MLFRSYRKISNDLDRLSLKKLGSHLIQEKYSKTFTIRVHPQENRRYYEKMILDLNLNAQLSKEQNVIEDLAKHEYIVGMETAPLFWAVKIGKKAFTTLPIKGKHSSLEFLGIKPITKLKFND